MFPRKTNYQHKEAFTKKPPRPMSTKYLEDELDALVRLILPLMEPCCFTCGTTKGLEVGHLWERRHRSTRWDTHKAGNCHRQCASCNMGHEGSPALYRGTFVRAFGEEAYRELELRAGNQQKLTYSDLLDLLEQKETQLKELKRLVAA